MKLCPLSDDGDEIVFPKFLKKCRIGRAEIKQALHGNESKQKAEKVSKSAVDFQLQGDSITVTNIGKNSIFIGAFGMPLEKLGPDQERVLNFGDVVGFRQDALIFRIESGSTRKTSKSDEINEENTQALSEETHDKEETKIDSENAEWTSGSISNHEDENKISENEAGPSRINTAAPARRRPPCEYGRECYRRNPNHKIEFCHPGDDDWWDPLVENDDPDFQDPRPECQYGILCYQKSEAHRRKFQHNTAGSAPKRRAARKAEEKNKEISSDSDDLLRESESEVEYDISGEEEERPAKMQKISAEAKELINETKKMLRDRNF